MNKEKDNYFIDSQKFNIKSQIQKIWGEEWLVIEAIDGYLIENKHYEILIKITKKEISTEYAYKVSSTPVHLLDKLVKTVQLMQS